LLAVFHFGNLERLNVQMNSFVAFDHECLGTPRLSHSGGAFCCSATLCLCYNCFVPDRDFKKMEAALKKNATEIEGLQKRVNDLVAKRSGKAAKPFIHAENTRSALKQRHNS